MDDRESRIQQRAEKAGRTAYKITRGVVTAVGLIPAVVIAASVVDKLVFEVHDKVLGPESSTQNFVLSEQGDASVFHAQVKDRQTGKTTDATFVDATTGKHLGSTLYPEDLTSRSTLIEYNGHYSPITFELHETADHEYKFTTGKITDAPIYAQIQTVGDLSSPTNIPQLGPPAASEMGFEI